jgi:hypothetical protein
MIPPLEIWHARHIALAHAAAREPDPAVHQEQLRTGASHPVVTPGAPPDAVRIGGSRDRLGPVEYQAEDAALADTTVVQLSLAEGGVAAEGHRQ